MARHSPPTCPFPRFLLLLASILAGGLAFAQEPEVIRLPQQPVPSAPAPAPGQQARRAPVNVQEVLGELWFRRKAFLEKGDAASAERQVQLMRDVVRREGILSADDIAGAFLTDGARALDAGNLSRAIQSFHLAKEFAPDRPGAAFAVSRALWKERDFSGVLAAFFEGMQITLKNPTARATRLGNILLVLLAGSVLGALLWCLIAALRTARQAQHDLYEARARALSESAAQTAAWILWLLPALLWMTGFWIFVYWLALATAYLKRQERILSVAACACFLVAVPTLGWITRESAVTTDPEVRFLLEAARGGSDPERIPALEERVKANPGEPVYHFLLAQAYQGTGSFEAALQEYREVQELDSKNANAWINSGNIFYLQGQYPQAAEEYRNAIQSNGRSALAYFNSHLALQGALRLEEADAAFRKARELDNALVTSILSSGGAEDRREPVEAHYTGEEILERLQRHSGKTGSASLWTEWINPLSLAGAAGLLGCLALPWAAAGWGLGAAQRCVKCGRPFCRRCQVGLRREEGYCTACRHLYVLKDPVAPRVREQREKLVAAHERWQWISRRLVSLILPGAGQIQGGRTLLGAFLLWTTCISLAALLLSAKLLAFPRVALFDSGGWSRIAPVATIALCWLAGNTLAFHKKGRE